MLNYNAPNGELSSIDSFKDGTGKDGSTDVLQSEQLQTFYWLKKSLIEARKDQYFTQLASTENMPKHYGKVMKAYHYLPLLDDRNINDQGIDASGATIKDGNLYGSSRDIGTINARLPLLTEHGGRVNRVGFSRFLIEGSIQKFGFFYEFTKEALDFDSDSELQSHLSRELINGAVQLTEAVLQRDLLSSAGVILYPGDATSDVTVNDTAVLTYDVLARLDMILTDNRTPKQTKVITGSRLIDTRVVPACRVAYVGIELLPVLRQMKDYFGNKAFIEVQHYADAGSTLQGEVGSIDNFRIICVPEMLHWAGAGADSAKEEFHSTGGKYDIYPFLVIGDDSFSTIGFQTDGKSVKFSTLTKMPGRETADRNEPYGELGFSSIKWYYGFLLKRPERIGLIKTVAPI